KRYWTATRGPLAVDIVGAAIRRAYRAQPPRPAPTPVNQEWRPGNTCASQGISPIPNHSSTPAAYGAANATKPASANPDSTPRRRVVTGFVAVDPTARTPRQRAPA